MENAAAAVPYIGMVIVQFAQVGLMVAGKVAIANGMTTFTFIFYSNIMASLILLPICVSIHRSGGHPPLVPTFLCGFFVLGFIGFMVQVLGYAGLLLTSASLSTTILNLIPAFTFIFALLFRMEKLKYKSSSTAAKCMGTLVSIVGAVVATLYQGPSLLGTTSPSQLITLITASSISSPWLIGGFLLTLDSIVSAIFIIAQAVVIRRYPAELILMLFYSCCIAILSAATSLILEKDDLKAWSLNSTMRFIPVIYSGLFGTVFQVTIIIWCVRRKGPVFASIFHPLGVIFSIAAGIIILGETFYLGSLVGALVVVVGFYAVMWGKVKEAKTTHEEEEEHHNDGKRRVPLLPNHTHHRQDIVTP
ncbi:hypothetical protein C2S51_038633 [Perilla frutescens var. frutescens]|nr:hypothetical protein C2S51_038633 [Perilla frutescens var. frutescens]